MPRSKADPEAIRTHRVAQRLSIAETARRAGLTREHLSKIEAGSHAPRDYTLAAIADALGVKAAELLATEQAS